MAKNKNKFFLKITIDENINIIWDPSITLNVFFFAQVGKKILNMFYKEYKPLGLQTRFFNKKNENLVNGVYKGYIRTIRRHGNRSSLRK